MRPSVAAMGGWAAVRHRQLPRKENNYHEKNEPVESNLGKGYLRLDELQLQKGKKKKKKKRIRSRRVKRRLHILWTKMNPSTNQRRERAPTKLDGVTSPWPRNKKELFLPFPIRCENRPYHPTIGISSRKLIKPRHWLISEGL